MDDKLTTYVKNNTITKINEAHQVSEYSCDNKVYKYEYDSNNLLMKIINPSGNIVTYKRNVDGQIIEYLDTDGIHEIYNYKDGEMVSFVNTDGVLIKRY